MLALKAAPLNNHFYATFRDLSTIPSIESLHHPHSEYLTSWLFVELFMLGNIEEGIIPNTYQIYKYFLKN